MKLYAYIVAFGDSAKCKVCLESYPWQQNLLQRSFYWDFGFRATGLYNIRAMLYLAVGPNSYTSHQFLHKLVEDTGLQPKYADEQGTSPGQEGTDLFGASQLLVHQHELDPKLFGAWQNSTSHHFCYLLGSTAKDKKLVAFAEAQGAVVYHCPELTEDEVRVWLGHKAKEIGVVLTPKQVAELLGFSSAVLEEVGSESRQWWLDSALSQLSLVTVDGVVAEDDFQALCSVATSGTALEILEAVGQKQTTVAAKKLYEFLRQPQGEEKTAALQLVALLLSQLRVWSVVAFAGAIPQNKAKALEITGWKAGRWFYAQKAIRGLRPEAVLESLRRLGEVELELKSSTLPAGSMILLALQPLLN